MLFLFATTFFACSENSTTDTTQNATAKPVKTTSSKGIPAVKEACDYMEEERLKAIFKWEGMEFEKSPMMSLERYKDLTVCVGHVLGPDATIQLRLAWKNKSAIKNKALEKLYNNLLTNGERMSGEITAAYEEISNADGKQVIFGVGEGKHGYVYYSLKKRYGNEAEINMAYNQIGGDKADILKKMQEFVDGMN